MHLLVHCLGVYVPLRLLPYRLKLLGSQTVLEAYDTYDKLVFQSTAHPIQHRPENPNAVVHARDRLVDMMAKDLQGVCWQRRGKHVK